MATEHVFNGQTITIPGAYSTIKSGIKNPSQDLSYGVTLVIDTGSGATWGGGAGIDGELSQGEDCLYVFEDIQEMQNHAKGGLWHLLARPLFRPNGSDIGVSSVIFARAATTTCAEIELAFGSEGVSGGFLNIKVRDEGIIGNGVLEEGQLIKGFAALMQTGLINEDAFVLKFYKGTYAGVDLNSQGFGETLITNSIPTLLCTSIEFTNIAEVIDWMNTDFEFNKFFKLASSEVDGDGSIVSNDSESYSDYTLATGGTEVYSTANLNKVLDKVTKLNISFILADDYGNSAAQSANNVRLLDHIIDESKFKPELYVAAGSTISEFNFSKQTTAFFNNDSVTVVHGGVRKSSRNASNNVPGFKTWPSIYRAATFLGREAGLAPQVPTTFKTVGIVEADVHPLDDKEVVQALKAGLMVSRFEDGVNDIVKGVNSLQNNQFLINEDGTTHSKQAKRIARQLNKEIIVNAKRELLKQPLGVNRNTLSDEDVKTWIKSYLGKKVAEPTKDNLILSYQDVTVTRNQDAYFVTYKFVHNGEISFLFSVGFFLDI